MAIAQPTKTRSPTHPPKHDRPIPTPKTRSPIHDPKIVIITRIFHRW
ncbi:MAG: hypothetical protein M1G31_04125 [Pseudanabaena sp. Salubria-1]|nr:hypothetical protein [Pseudanabaena sp. Salubria-1]